MTADEIIERIRAHNGEVRLERDGRTLALLGRSRIPDNLAALVHARADELRLLLRDRSVLRKHTFTECGKLCSRCLGIGLVAVVGGDLACMNCVLAEAQRLASKGAGT